MVVTFNLGAPMKFIGLCTAMALLISGLSNPSGAQTPLPPPPPPPAKPPAKAPVPYYLIIIPNGLGPNGGGGVAGIHFSTIAACQAAQQAIGTGTSNGTLQWTTFCVANPAK